MVFELAEQMEGSMMNLKNCRQNGDDLLPTIAIVIMDLLVVNINRGMDSHFHSAVAMPGSNDILAFLSRIQKHTKCSEACFVVGLIYVDRIVNSHDFVLTPQNVYQTYLTAVMLAAKFHEDVFYNNAFYAQLAGRTLKEINTSEIELISLLQFSLVVRSNLYHKYFRELCDYRARANALANQQQQQQQQQHQQQQHQQQQHQQAMMIVGVFAPHAAPIVPMVIPHAPPPETGMECKAPGVLTPTAQQVVYDFAAPIAYGHDHLVYPVSPGAAGDGAGMHTSALPAPPGLEQQQHHYHRQQQHHHHHHHHHQQQQQQGMGHPVVYQTMVPTLPIQVATVTPMLVGGFAPLSPSSCKTVYPIGVPASAPAPLVAMEERHHYY